MRPATLVGILAATFWATAVVAEPTPQTLCDWTRALAWKRYSGCVEAAAARRYKLGLANTSDSLAAFAKCRHKYLKPWPKYQLKVPLAGSRCVGARFVDNVDETVSDNLTGLVWEQKTNLDMTANPADRHDADNVYTWSTGAPYGENGTVFTDLLRNLNNDGFGGANGWRLPTLAELQTILLDFPCTGSAEGPRCICPSTPCVEDALLPSEYHSYWTATPIATSGVWFVAPFQAGTEAIVNQSVISYHVRAVRGGL